MKILFALFFCSVFSLGSYTFAADSEPYPAPKFSAKDFRTGKMVHLSDFTGKVIILNFWSPGCPATPLEAPSLARLSKKSKILVIGIVKSPPYESAEIRKFINKYNWNFPILISDGAVEKQYDERMVYPTAFLINKEGSIVGKVVNYIDFESTEVGDVLENILNGKLIWYYRYLRRLK